MTGFRKRALAASLLLALAFLTEGFPGDLSKPKKTWVFSFVLGREDALNACMARRDDRIEDGDSGAEIRVSYGDAPGCVVFRCGAVGFGGPDGVYYGFYWTDDGQPRPCHREGLQREGSGFAWYPSWGGNMWYYTEKIAPHWYYYAAES